MTAGWTNVALFQVLAEPVHRQAGRVGPVGPGGLQQGNQHRRNHVRQQLHHLLTLCSNFGVGPLYQTNA